MKDLTKQVVILDNFYSPYIRQAILILRDGAPADRTPIVDDAERIINAYLKKNGRKKRNRKLDLLCIGAILIGLSLLAAYFLL